MNTLKSRVEFKGVGLHSGKPVKMAVSKSSQTGICFIYVGNRLQVGANNIGINHLRSTQLTNGVICIQTPEHFLAACYALKLTHIQVELTQSELPILDGSAIEFIHRLKPELVPIKDVVNESLPLTQDIKFRNNNSYYFGSPSNDLKIAIYLTYPKHWIKSMCTIYRHSTINFINQIASARTYGFTHELDHLKKLGLAKGGSLENALLVSDDGYVNEPRFEDECTRHKILDFIGDMAIAGKNITGDFILIRPSHQGNCEFLKTIMASV